MKWLNRTLVSSPYCYGLCRSEKAFHRELKRMSVPRADWPAFIGNGGGSNSYYDATTHFFENKTSGLAAIVCIGNTRKGTTAVVHALLAHEAVHIWQEIKKHLGETNPSHEFEAYAIQQITQNLITAYGEKP